MILDDGCAWNGCVYRSLSQVAKAITGTNWNGHRFFGLKAVRTGSNKKRNVTPRPNSLLDIGVSPTLAGFAPSVCSSVGPGSFARSRGREGRQPVAHGLRCLEEGDRSRSRSTDRIRAAAAGGNGCKTGLVGLVVADEKRHPASKWRASQKESYRFAFVEARPLHFERIVRVLYLEVLPRLCRNQFSEGVAQIRTNLAV